ncbi:hypothetical protein [Pseudomonas atacamensis]|uniref:hypothetical protein n=1 Tax=Pseudomonas atacamensis TaxID=2565368 RepID=UPI002480E86A|nr:hypothetical protein [Pseudomonas atacamensis]WGT34371.1 hypothetical protein QG303_02125 [Pseudomonas atacamensis]
MVDDVEKPSTDSPPISKPIVSRKKNSGKAKPDIKKASPLKKVTTAKGQKKTVASSSKTAKFPRHTIEKVLRIPRAIQEQNAGKTCSEREAAQFVGVGFGGPFRVEVSSALKYGLLERKGTGQIAITELARRIIRPQQTEDEVIGLREAAINAPDIGEVYQHYRGENLPDAQFFRNALIDKFNLPEDKASEFENIFLETMREARLLDEHNGKRRILDISNEPSKDASDDRLKKLGRQVSIKSTDTCFVMMPFANPIGSYYSTIYEPAIQKAGLTPIRADADIFGTGKIIDQIWQGINNSKILVAELTHRNPNVFYELGLAHALNKPVVLICSNESDVPFDLQHIRVIYYDVTDPFWGNKLIEKIAENILSAIRTPEEAVFKAALQA